MSPIARLFPRTRESAPDLQPQALAPGSLFRDWRIERRLARGATASVYAATEATTGQPVALKALHWADDPSNEQAWIQESERFLHAAERAAQLMHPAIVQVYGGGRWNGVVFVVMELAGGYDLIRYTDARRLLPEPVALDIAARLAEALAYAHRQGVVHRDVKPANAMVDLVTGRVLLADFGLARVADAQATRSGLMLGSPQYMAPELLAGASASPASDLYSLGVLAYELLAGQPPFPGASMGELLRAVATSPPRPLAAVRPELDAGHAGALDALLGTLLAKTPAERISDGDAWAGAARAVRARWDAT